MLDTIAITTILLPMSHDGKYYAYNRDVYYIRRRFEIKSSPTLQTPTLLSYFIANIYIYKYIYSLWKMLYNAMLVQYYHI